MNGAFHIAIRCAINNLAIGIATNEDTRVVTTFHLLPRCCHNGQVLDCAIGEH